MTRCSLTLALLLGSPLLAGAQEKKDVDTSFLRTLSQTRSFMLGRPVRPLPTPDGKTVLFLRSQPRSSKLSLFAFDVASGKTTELLTPDQVLKGNEEKLTPEEKAARERMRVSAGGFTTFQVSDDGSLILLSLSGKLYTFNRADAQVQELKTGKGTLLDPKFAPTGRTVSYVRDNDLYLIDLATQKETAVTQGGGDLTTHGVAEFVAQEEMDRFTGYWWSPDAKQIAYQESDHRGVEVWHVADPIHPEQKPTPFFYPRPGKANVAVKLGVVNVTGGPTTWITWDQAKYPYLATVHWAKGGPLLVVVQSRDQRELAVLDADPKTGKATTVLVEKSDTWVNLRQEVPRWLPSGEGFLWVSERDGLPRLEVRARNGRLRRVLTPDDLVYHGLVGVNEAGNEVVFNASKNPTESHLYRVKVTDAFAEPELLTKDAGLHGAVFARDHQTWVHTTRPLTGMPTATVLVGAEKRGELPSVAEEPPHKPIVDYVIVGDRKMHAAIVWPRNIDARKKYPVLVDVYGGPHHQHVLAAQNRWLLDQWYADQGFIVVAIDGRGTPGRGSAWERAIYQKFGSVPLDDQVAGLKALGEKYPMMDLTRVGVDGWSFGGYMAALAVMRRPDVFHVGVAGAPVCDWLDYDTHYTERYLGVPPKADAAYKEGSLLTYAGELKRPLLIMHGTADDNVYFRHSLKMVDSLFRSGKDFEMLPLSGLTHMVPDPVVMEQLHGRIVRFLKKHLGDPK